MESKVKAASDGNIKLKYLKCVLVLVCIQHCSCFFSYFLRLYLKWLIDWLGIRIEHSFWLLIQCVGVGCGEFECSRKQESCRVVCLFLFTCFTLWEWVRVRLHFSHNPLLLPCSVVMVTGTACSFQRASSRLRGPRTGFFATERSDVELIMVGGVRWLTDEPGQKLSLSGWRAAALLLLLSHRHTATRKLQIRSHFKTSFMFSCFKCKDLFCEFLKVQINVSEMKLNTTVWKYKI